MQESLAMAGEVRGKLAGAVLNKADPSWLSRMESYKGGEYRAYFH